MKYGANTLIWTGSFDREHLALLPTLKQAGFDGVEIARFDWKGFSGPEFRAELEKHGLGCTVCTALTGQTSLASDDSAIRATARDFLEQAIRASAALGADVMAGPLLAPVGQLLGRRRNDDEWKWAVEGIQALAPVLQGTGLPIAIEPLNRFETYFLNTVEDGVRFCEQVNHPQVGLLVDTFHSNVEEKDVAEAYRIAGKHLFHVHTCENDRGIPGTGHVPWPAVFDALADCRYDNWCVIESFGFGIREIAAAACIWRDLAKTPDQIAIEGLPFLKQMAKTRGMGAAH